MSSSPFFSPTDGFVYGNMWSNGDIAWWSTREAAEQHSHSLILNETGVLVRRAYSVGETEELARVGDR